MPDSVTVVRFAAVVTTALVLAGCGTANRDAASTSAESTTSTSSIPAMTPAAPPAPAPDTGRPVAFKDYLASINVTGEPVHLDQAPGLTVTVPVPDGWAQTNDPMFATGVEFIQPVGAESSLPSVTLMAIRLIGDFDAKEAIRHANSDALAPMASNVIESYDDFDGFPSAATQGVAGGDQQYSRIVLADVPSTKQRYLVQLTATTSADQPIDQSPQLNAVVSGFKVAVS
ncbi:LpqN/LpqT family lipoprotein [Mycolicibacterium sp.]|uniref:LpqN/LpqT family lipoprotein n=1 Tax=Mycolicibacterium sp. TaxID=2320850 RepID=UPI001A23ACF6|nr:LpqN/LpqT family lipoprotein [Mycolicibacterium sp.]MBJ7341502.1 LpqN/LpqT family lipoprotein [Mycolicibacterium sp.]